MRPFDYRRATSVADAATPDAVYLAGGTTLLDLMKLDVATPEHLVDITRLPLSGVRRTLDTVRIGATTTMAEAAADPETPELLRQALLAGASPQLRNTATFGGNLLQAVRCPYYRDTAYAECNRRDPGSGCAAEAGGYQDLAILGTGGDCDAVHPSDLAVALTALDAMVHVHGRPSITVEALYAGRGALEPGDLITGIELHDGPPHVAFVKVRERASFTFALTAAAVALEVGADGVVRRARIALGAVAPRPWRSRAAEEALIGQTAEAFPEAAARAVAGAVARAGAEYKVELARNTVLRALTLAGGQA